MKAQILKIAGVKNEKEFYKKFPTEEAFLKKHGKELKKAQVGTSIDAATTKPVKPINFGDIYAQAEATNMGISLEEKKRQEALAAQKASSQGGASGMAGLIGGAMKALGGADGDIIGNVASMFRGGGNLPMGQYGMSTANLPTPALPKMQGLSDSAKALPTLTSPVSTASDTYDFKDAGNALLGQAGSIIGNIQAIGQMQKQQDQQKQFAQISDITAQAAESQDVDAGRQKRYVRPEDMVIQPGQMGNPYGSGTNYLQARNGAEIQNTFAPNDIYTDMGYEPLNDSNVKQFQFGGIANAAGSWITGGGFQATPEGQIGSIAGKTIGSLIPIPGASQVLEGVGGLVGGLFGGSRQKETDNYTEQGKQNTMRAAGANFGNAVRSQFSGSLEDGGWVSNDWMPQTIAKFGEYDVKDLLKPPHDADMLRAGGHLKEYTPPSARAMYTGRNQMEYGGQMAMGGDLQVHRGKAETMSYNPFLPDGGETIMFRGPSHDDGGMPITFGENGVEVEGGEPAVKLQDGGSAEGNLVVFGDMYMPGSKQKFKHYAADLSKTEAKQNKLIDKSTKLVNDLDVNTEFDKLSLQAANANILGANMKLKDIATKKTEAAALQNAILETAKEQGLVSADLAKGKIVKDKEAAKMMAKYGAKMTTAQTGTSVDPNDTWINKILDYESKSGSASGQGLSNFGYNTRNPKTKEEAIKYFKEDYLPKVDYLPQELKGRAADWMFNTGKDPRIPLLLAAGKIKSNAFGPAAERIELAQDPELLDETWNKYSSEINKKAKDPEFLKKFDTARKVMYQNINKLPDGSINPAYGKTWKGRTEEIFKDDAVASAPTLASPVSPMVSPAAPIVPMGMNAPSSARFQPGAVNTNVNMFSPDQPIDARQAMMSEMYSPINMDNYNPTDIKNIPFTPYDGTFVQKRDAPAVVAEDVKGKKKGKEFNWKDASLFASSVMPFLRPSNQEPLDPAQLSGEMFALANNQLEPVQAQLYTPQLGTPYDISLQDQLNASQADFNAMQRQLAGNPEALAALAAQKRIADTQVLGNQFRANQAERARVYEANRQAMNEAQRANLGILDQQFQRQSTAKSKTKQEALTALQSIASKLAQQNLSNRTLGVYENMYNYRYAPGGQAYSLNAPYSFNIPTVGSGAKSTSDIALTEAERLQALADAQKIKEANAKTKKRNGDIVKAIKGL